MKTNRNSHLKKLLTVLDLLSVGNNFYFLIYVFQINFLQFFIPSNLSLSLSLSLSPISKIHTNQGSIQCNGNSYKKDLPKQRPFISYNYASFFFFILWEQLIGFCCRWYLNPSPLFKNKEQLIFVVVDI